MITKPCDKELDQKCLLDMKMIISIQAPVCCNKIVIITDMHCIEKEDQKEGNATTHTHTHTIRM